MAVMAKRGYSKVRRITGLKDDEYCADSSTSTHQFMFTYDNVGRMVAPPEGYRYCEVCDQPILQRNNRWYAWKPPVDRSYRIQEEPDWEDLL